MRILIIALTALSLATSARAQMPDFHAADAVDRRARHNDAAEAKRLLEAGADPNGARFIGFPPILLATLRQDVDLLRLMARKGADLNVRDASGATALMWAAFNEHGDATASTSCSGSAPIRRRSIRPAKRRSSGRSAAATRRWQRRCARLERRTPSSSNRRSKRRFRCSSAAALSLRASRDATRAITNRCRRWRSALPAPAG